MSDIPPKAYLGRDYAALRALMLERLSKSIPGPLTGHPADPMTAIVEVLAQAGDYLAYYQDAVATEAYLATARKRLSVRRHARLLDYRLHEGLNARTWLSINYTNDTTKLLPAGSKVTARGLDAARLADADDDAPIVFETMAGVMLDKGLNWLGIEPAGAIIPRGTTSFRFQCSLDAFRSLASGSFLLLECPEFSQVVRVVDLREVDDHNTQIDIHIEDAVIASFPTDSAMFYGNVVPCDHGCTQSMDLPPVPDSGEYAPLIETDRLVHAEPLTDDMSAAALFRRDPRAAAAQVQLLDTNGYPWFSRPDLIDAHPYSRAFVVEPDDGGFRLRFGDGRYGRRPAPGLGFKASWREGGGVDGNVSAGVLVSVPDIGAATAAQPFCATGGLEREHIADAKRNAPFAYHEEKRAVTAEDWLALVRAHPMVKKATLTDKSKDLTQYDICVEPAAPWAPLIGLRPDFQSIRSRALDAWFNEPSGAPSRDLDTPLSDNAVRVTIGTTEWQIDSAHFEIATGANIDPQSVGGKMGERIGISAKQISLLQDPRLPSFIFYCDDSKSRAGKALADPYDRFLTIFFHSLIWPHFATRWVLKPVVYIDYYMSIFECTFDDVWKNILADFVTYLNNRNFSYWYLELFHLLIFDLKKLSRREAFLLYAGQEEAMEAFLKGNITCSQIYVPDNAPSDDYNARNFLFVRDHWRPKALRSFLSETGLNELMEGTQEGGFIWLSGAGKIDRISIPSKDIAASLRGLLPSIPQTYETVVICDARTDKPDLLLCALPFETTWRGSADDTVTKAYWNALERRLLPERIIGTNVSFSFPTPVLVDILLEIFPASADATAQIESELSLRFAYDASDPVRERMLLDRGLGVSLGRQELVDAILSIEGVVGVVVRRFGRIDASSPDPNDAEIAISPSETLWTDLLLIGPDQHETVPGYLVCKLAFPTGN